MRFDTIKELGLELIQNGIPVLPRDDGTSLIGPIFSRLDYEKLREVLLNKYSFSAIFGYHPENKKFPIQFDSKGYISFGSPAIVPTYRVYDFNDCSLEDAFMLDENGNYNGPKGSRLSKVPLESILSSDALSGLIIMQENPDFYQAVKANWQINGIIDSYCLYAKVDVNGFSGFINNPQAILSMNYYFHKLSEFAREHRILTAENTGESIVLYPETTEQVKEIRDWINEQSENPFTTKMVVLGPRKVRRLHVTKKGFCIKAEPPVQANKVEITERKVKGQKGFFGHNMGKGDEGLHL
jgi:hypothetical protein